MQRKERIPLHDHSDGNSGGRIGSSGLQSAVVSTTTTTTTSGGAANLSELGDVNVITTPPADNDALTYDSASGKWVPSAVAVAALDDVGDVNAPTPSDGDVLTWDSTPGEWVALAPTGGGSFATPAIVLGTAAAAGAASTVIRSDSTIVAFDATAPTTQALGDSAATGSAAVAARRDHKHAMPTAAVTTSGLTMATARLLGRTTASTGAIEEITVGTGLSLSAGSLTATGGSGAAIQYGTLKPATPTDDFNASSLNGAWTARSINGSWSSSNLFTQALDGSHVSLGFNSQGGALWRSSSNVDQEWLAGGMFWTAVPSLDYMMGIAVLNSSGTGVGVISYNDSHIYLCTITTWTYTGFSQTVALYGHNGTQTTPMAFRLVRSGNTWTGYVSADGCNWHSGVAGSFPGTMSSTITVDRVAVGLFYNSAVGYGSRLYVDWVHMI